MSAHLGETRLLRYVLDELDARERLEVDLHLEVCSGCRARVAAEHRLDEWIVASGTAAPAGAAERALAGLWSAIDGADEATGDQPEAPRALVPAARRWALVLPTLVVLLLALLLVVRRPAPATDMRLAPAPNSRYSPSLDRGDGGVAVPAPLPPTLAVEPLPLAPAGVLEASSIDAVRLEAARRAVAVAVCDASERFPFLAQPFLDACEHGLQPLRREGWPVGSLVRGLALGDDEGAAAAALRYAAADRSTLDILAAALALPARRSAVTAILEQEAVVVEPSAALVRALERIVAAGSGEPGRGPALAALGRTPGPRCRASLERLLQRAVAGLERSGSRRAELSPAERAFLDLVAGVPAELSLPRLVEVAGAERLRGPTEQLFLAQAPVAPDVAARAVTDSLGDRERALVVLGWVREARLLEAVDGLLLHLEEAPDDAAVLETLVVLGGARVAAGLFELWAEQQALAGEVPLREALQHVLAADDRLPPALGAGIDDGRVEDLVALAHGLPAAQRGALLLGCLAAWPAEHELDREGHRANLLVALSRLGQDVDGRRLLEWIEPRPRTDPVLPLAWAVAGRLSAAEAEAAWERAGGRATVLRSVASATARRLEGDTQPPRGLLSPLRQALLEAPASRPVVPESLP